MIVQLPVRPIDPTLFAGRRDVAPEARPAFQAHELGGLGVHRAGGASLFIGLLFLDDGRTVSDLRRAYLTREGIGLADVTCLRIGAGRGSGIKDLGHSGKLAALLRHFEADGLTCAHSAPPISE